MHFAVISRCLKIPNSLVAAGGSQAGEHIGHNIDCFDCSKADYKLVVAALAERLDTDYCLKDKADFHNCFARLSSLFLNSCYFIGQETFC